MAGRLRKALDLERTDDWDIPDEEVWFFVRSRLRELPSGLVARLQRASSLREAYVAAGIELPEGVDDELRAIYVVACVGKYAPSEISARVRRVCKTLQKTAPPTLPPPPAKPSRPRASTKERFARAMERELDALVRRLPSDRTPQELATLRQFAGERALAKVVSTDPTINGTWLPHRRGRGRRTAPRRDEHIPRGFAKSRSGWLIALDEKPTAAVAIAVRHRYLSCSSCPGAERLDASALAELGACAETALASELDRRAEGVEAKKRWAVVVGLLLEIYVRAPRSHRPKSEAIVRGAETLAERQGWVIPNLFTPAELRKLTGARLERVTPSERGGGGIRSVASIMSALTRKHHEESRRDADMDLVRSIVRAHPGIAGAVPIAKLAGIRKGRATRAIVLLINAKQIENRGRAARPRLFETGPDPREFRAPSGKKARPLSLHAVVADEPRVASGSRTGPDPREFRAPCGNSD